MMTHRDTHGTLGCTKPNHAMLICFYCTKLIGNRPWSAATVPPPHLQAGCSDVLQPRPTHADVLSPPACVAITQLMSVQEKWQEKKAFCSVYVFSSQQLNRCNLSFSPSPLSMFVLSDICSFLVCSAVSVVVLSRAKENPRFPDSAASKWKVAK